MRGEAMASMLGEISCWGCIKLVAEMIMLAIRVYKPKAGQNRCIYACIVHMDMYV